MTNAERITGAEPPRPASVSTYATWSLRDVALGILWALGVIVLVEVAVSGIVVALHDASSGLDVEDSPELFLGTSVSSSIRSVLLVALVINLVRRREASWPQLGLPDLARPLAALSELLRSIWRHRGLVLVSFLAAESVVIGYGVIIRLLGADFLEPGAQFPEAWFDYAEILPVFAFAVAVLTPLGEETLFRGFVYGGFRRRTGPLAAAAASGAIFAVAHIDPGFYLPFALVGVILARAYERSGSLAAPIGVHFLFNLTSVLVLAFVPAARG